MAKNKYLAYTMVVLEAQLALFGNKSVEATLAGNADLVKLADKEIGLISEAIEAKEVAETPAPASTSNA